jgi:hypothetical protein
MTPVYIDLGSASARSYTRLITCFAKTDSGWLDKPAELKALTDQGILPFVNDMENDRAMPSEFFPSLMGQCAGAVTEVKSAKAIVDEMMADAMASLKRTEGLRRSRL